MAEDTNYMDGLNGGQSPNVNVKSQSNEDAADISQMRQLHKKPFKLRFGKQLALGQSTISSIKPSELPPIITSKFHTKEYNDFLWKNKKSIDRVEQKLDTLYKYDPRKTLKLPKLESHTYGWYHNVHLSDRTKDDRRFNFGIRNSEMIKYRLQILASDTITAEKKIILPKKI